MTEVVYLTSAVLMGALLVAVGVAVGRREGRVSALPRGEPEHASRWDAASESLTRLTRSPTTWTLTFLALTVGVGVGVILFVGGGPVPEGTQALAGVAVAGVLALVVSAFLFVGTYFTAKSKGRSTAWGVAEGTIALGLLLIGAIVLALVFG
ncbi:hypothetical protein [Natronorarus salvus]|uniref:hypothetical protein n=1 Tax=Natronorarus salvus TaxID=3117733 RepID=UPI002F262621